MLLDVLLLFVFCYPVRRVIATAANKQTKQRRERSSLTRRSGREASGRGRWVGRSRRRRGWTSLWWKPHHLSARGRAALHVWRGRPSLHAQDYERGREGGRWRTGGARGRYITITINSGAAQPRDLSHQLPVIGAAVSCVLWYSFTLDECCARRASRSPGYLSPTWCTY